MNVELESAARLNALKQGIEAKTGETYPDLTDGVNALIAGFGQGGADAEAIIDAFITGSITTDINSNVETIRQYALSDCENITNMKFPKAETVQFRAFQNCKSLKKVSLPVWKGSAQAMNTFQYCTALEEVDMPACENIRGVFYGCTALKSIRLPALLNIRQEAFINCKSLDTIILPNNNIVTLVNISAFTGTPFASGGTGGTVYVPASLIEAYKTATNWVTLYDAGTCNFAAIEGSEYE